MEKEQKDTLVSLALQHEEYSGAIKKYNEIKTACRAAIQHVLNESDIQIIDLEETAEDGKLVRIQEITKSKIIYDDDKLLKLLRAKGKDTFKRAVVLSIDQTALEELYNEGELTYQEIQDCVNDVAESKVLDIRRVKQGALQDDVKNGKSEGFKFNPQGKGVK